MVVGREQHPCVLQGGRALQLPQQASGERPGLTVADHPYIAVAHDAPQWRVLDVARRSRRRGAPPRRQQPRGRPAPPFAMAAPQRRDLVRGAARALDDEQRPAVRHRLAGLEPGAGAAPDEHHDDRRVARQLGGQRDEQLGFAAPFVAVGEHEMTVVGIERRPSLRGLAGQGDPAPRRDAEEHLDPGAVAGALGAGERHHARRGPAVHDHGVRRVRRQPDRGTQQRACDRQLRLVQVVCAARDHDDRPALAGREPELRQQPGRSLVAAGLHQHGPPSVTEVDLVRQPIARRAGLRRRRHGAHPNAHHRRRSRVRCRRLWLAGRRRKSRFRTQVGRAGVRRDRLRNHHARRRLGRRSAWTTEPGYSASVKPTLDHRDGGASGYLTAPRGGWRVRQLRVSRPRR